MKLRLLSVALFSSLLMMCPGLMAQISTLDNQQNLNSVGSDYSPSNNMMRTFDNRFKGIEGSPYLLNAWKEGQIISHEGSVYNDIMIRYNIEKDILSIASNEGGTITIPRETIAEFTLKDQYETFRFLAIEDPAEPTESPMFCQILEEGPVQVLVQRRKSFVPGSSNLAFGGQTNSQYKFHQNRYFVRKRVSGETFKVGRLNGKMFKFLGDNQKEMKDISRDRQWFVSDPEQLVMLIRFYNVMARVNE